MIENCEHLLRVLTITRRLSGNEYRLGTKTGGHAQRHGGMNTELASCVRCCGYDAALVALPADHDRFVTQRRVEQFFDGHKKRIHVDVTNNPFLHSHTGSNLRCSDHPGQAGQI